MNVFFGVQIVGHEQQILFENDEIGTERVGKMENGLLAHHS